MRTVAPVVVALALLVVSACGGSSSSTTPTGPTSTPTTTPTPAATTFTLSGPVSDDGAQVVAGALLTILDGPNANRTTTTDGSGRCSFTGLMSSGFSLRIREDGYDDPIRSVTLTSKIWYPAYPVGATSMGMA